MCVVLFYQTEWFNNRSEKSSENCFQFSFVVLFCVQYLFLVASSLQPAGQWFLRSFSLHASRSPSLGSPRGLRPVESLVLIFCLLLARLQDLRRKWWLDEARRCGDFYLEGAHQCLVHRHHPAGIVELSTVVGGWEQSDQLPLSEKLVSVLDNLEGLCCVTLLLLCWVPCFPRV